MKLFHLITFLQNNLFKIGPQIAHVARRGQVEIERRQRAPEQSHLTVFLPAAWPAQLITPGLH
jgi:hypothetical protein